MVPAPVIRARIAIFDVVEKCWWKLLVVWAKQGATLFLSVPRGLPGEELGG